MKKVLFLLLAVFSIWCGMVFAQSSNYPDSFQVEVSPSTFKVNQFVNLTITAIKNGEIMKNYDGDFTIEIREWDAFLQSYEMTVPDNGRWTIELTDQWVKTYSNGLMIQKAWQFTVAAVDFTDDNISGSALVTVTDDSTRDEGVIEILSPVQNIEETEDVLDIMATSPQFPNARVQIYLNNLAVKEGNTDGNGFFSESIQLSQAWSNTLQLKAVNAQGTTVAQSQVITFVYAPIWEDLLENVFVSPDSDLKIGDKINIEVITDENVNSAKFIFSWGQEYPLDKERDGYFTKTLTLTQTWNFIIDIQLGVASQNFDFPNSYFLMVDDNVQIVNLEVEADQETNRVINLAWDTDWGDAESYAIFFWTDENEDDPWTEFSDIKEYHIEGVDSWKTYYFQVYATDAEHIPEWIPSEISEIEYQGIQHDSPTIDPITGKSRSSEEIVTSTPTCIITSIKFRAEKIWNKNYLIWDPIENATKYRVYRSDFEDGSHKEFVGETEIPRYEYPFDEKAKIEKYAYYSIEAICANWDRESIPETAKVQVGPLEDLFLILVATLLLYCMYRLYTYREA